MLTNPGRQQIITQLPRKQSPTLTHQSQSQPQSQPQPQSQTQTHSQEELPCIIAQLKTYSKLIPDNNDILMDRAKRPRGQMKGTANILHTNNSLCIICRQSRHTDLWKLSRVILRTGRTATA